LARLVVFACIVVLAVAGALILISERGYRVARQETERRKLVEANRKLEAHVARLRTPNTLAERVKSLQLDLVPPAESLEQQLEREKKEAKQKAGDGSPGPKKNR